MANISEDYVSFETAKLLKEKGFNESCYTYYDDINDSINRFDKGYHFNNTSYPWGIPYDISKAKKYVIAPTLQMVMKWLREVHNIHIETFVIKNYDKKICEYTYTIMDLNFPGSDDGIDCCNKYKTYEQACESAIEYCLNKLI